MNGSLQTHSASANGCHGSTSIYLCTSLTLSSLVDYPDVTGISLFFYDTLEHCHDIEPQKLLIEHLYFGLYFCYRGRPALTATLVATSYDTGRLSDGQLDEDIRSYGQDDRICNGYNTQKHEAGRLSCSP